MQTKLPTKNENIYTCEVNVVYTDKQLDDVVNCKANAADFFEIYPTPYVREYKNATRFVYYADTLVADINFDLEGERIKLLFEVFNMSRPRGDFESIKAGTSLDEIMVFDPNGDYSALDTSVMQFWHSTHYTSDKYVVWIYYDGNYLVNNVEVECLTTRDGSLVEKIKLD